MEPIFIQFIRMEFLPTLQKQETGQTKEVLFGQSGMALKTQASSEQILVQGIKGINL